MRVKTRSGTLAAMLGLFAAYSAWVQAAEYQLETWSEAFDLPWSIAFLPDDSALVTELGGKLFLVNASGQSRQQIANVPSVYFAGQGGLFDVVLHPGFDDNRLVYLSYAEGGKADNGTAVARGRLDGSSL